MRIAQCLEYPIDQHGGTEVLVREIIRGLASEHEIVLVSADAASAFRTSSVASLVVEQITWRGAESEKGAAKALAERLKSLHVDLAHFHFGGTFGWGSRQPNFSPPIHLDRLKVPCLATNHGVFGALEGYVGPQRTWLTRLALWPAATGSRLQLIRHLRAEVAVSMNDYRALRRRYWPVRDKFRQIYHSRIHEEEVMQPRERTETILCAGTVGLRKGQPYLAEAYAQLAAGFPNWNLVFIGRAGDEETVQELRHLIGREELRGRVTWIQECSDAELRGWFQTVEIFAMPSLHEGLGLTLQEALYYGCACVASRIGGIPDLIQHEENGILVKRADAGDLASGLRRLMSDGALRQRLRERGRQSVLAKSMTSERMIAQYKQLYQTVVTA